MKKILSLLSFLYLSFFAAIAQNADLGIGGFEMPYAGATSVGHTIQIKADVRNFGFDDIHAGCALVTISVPSAICSITGLNSGSSSIWTIFSSSMPASVTLRNTGGTLPPDFEPYYIILDVLATNAGGPLTINSHSGLNGFQGGCMACGNLDPYNDDATTSITVSSASPVLSLHFSGFSVKDNGCSGSISWVTTDELYVSHFDVQQSFDGYTFNTIKTVASKGNGNNSYESDVSQPQKRMYYRVVGVDIDQKKYFGPVQTLQLTNCTKAATVQVFPVPAYRNQKISMLTNVNDKITYRLIDVSGNVVESGMFIRTKQIGVINNGTYLLEMTSANFKETKMIVVQ